MVFWTLANLDFSEVMWPFFWVVFVSRTAIFVLSVVFEFMQNGITGESIANAGIYGIFTSQSNDLAMGVPIMQAVFQQTHPNWWHMLYIVTLTRVMLNPFGFYMMEYGRAKMREKSLKEDSTTRRVGFEHEPSSPSVVVDGHEVAQPDTPSVPVGAEASSSSSSSTAPSDEDDLPGPDDPEYHSKNLSHILQRVFINPLVLSTVAGVICNVLFKSKLPGSIDPFFKKMGDSFNASALFVLGVAMNGHLDRLSDRRELITPLWLFVFKSIILPVISRFVAVFWGLESDAVLFAFILGTLPSSEQVPFFAYDYFVPCADMIAPAMVLGTFLAAPVMFVAAQMVNITLPGVASVAPSADTILTGTLRVFSAFGLVMGLYFLYILYYNRRTSTTRDKLLIGLILTQLILNLSSEFCGMKGSDGGETLRYAVVFSARLATRFWMLSLALNEILHYFYPKGTEQRYYPYFVVGSLGTSIALMLLTVIGGERTRYPNFEYPECYLRYGRFQWSLQVVVDTISVVILIYALYRINQRSESHRHSEEITRDAGAYTQVSNSEDADANTNAAEHAEPDSESKHDPVIAVEEEATTTHQRGGLSSRRAASARRTDHGSLSPTSSLSPPPEPENDFYAATPRRRPSISKHHHVSEKELESSWAFGMLIFLILTLLWMLCSIALSIWSTTSTKWAEPRIELLLLDGVLLSSQGIWTWMTFGLASHVRSPMRHVTRWVRQHSDSVINWKSS